MGDIVDIKPTRLAENRELIVDCCRYQEGLLTEARMRMKYGFAEKIWTDLGADTALLEAVEDEKIRRMRDGSAKRELAQKHVLKAPDVLANLMNDADVPARSRIDSAKALDAFAANGPAVGPAADRFVITINLGADTNGKQIIERYDRSIAINANDVDPNHVSPNISIGVDPTTVNDAPAIADKNPVELAIDALMARED